MRLALHFAAQAAALACRVHKASPSQQTYSLASTEPPPVQLEGSQTDNSTAFAGASSTLLSLRNKIRYQPGIVSMHNDGGNTGSTDFIGPRGQRNLAIALNQPLSIMLWGSGGTLTYVFSDSNSGKLVVGSFDPETLEILGSWKPSGAQALNGAYMSLIPGEKGGQIIVGTSQGNILVLERNHCKAAPSFELVRHITIAKELGPGESLFNNMIDIHGNIWFTIGAFLGTTNSTTVGYVTPRGDIFKTPILNQVVENGISVNRETIFVLTGPPTARQTKEDGLLSAYTASSNGISTTPELLWQLSYNAGSEVKPGGFARGSETTPSLLGDDFIAITDNDDDQLHLMITRQKQFSTLQVCKVPIFAPGAGAADIRPTVHFDGVSYKVAILNTYNATAVTSLLSPSFEINGDWNNKVGMPGGIATVEVSPDGSDCQIVWMSDLRVTMEPLLATSGTYVWYLVALDWRSGEEVYRIKARASGVFNDNFVASSIGPNGGFYQPVIRGVFIVKDRQE
ncbi:hypothetical protein JMJ77_0010556, partial [Colletotrichum scovillei]